MAETNGDYDLGDYDLDIVEETKEYIYFSGNITLSSQFPIEAEVNGSINKNNREIIDYTIENADIVYD
ncbi:hypothetical protein IQ215_07800 [Cyanobacterium stanieri LEGE 03274]|uniref:Uncharacterized protein n=1 Tax=Cyanobacterium stanieri LEGE 03274 TaxID=1828756 RepID=A0ABR9V3X3_9CHRO|nr:hypothetical protein [Cyanobacterium stanieri]MBE9222599.1 hypothetical protein [Cyanobacterium stanieri LEGE 03274]